MNAKSGLPVFGAEDLPDSVITLTLTILVKLKFTTRSLFMAFVAFGLGLAILAAR